MITLAIAVAFTVVLLTIGLSWIEVGIAIPLVLVISRGTTCVESWVERRTGRKINSKSAAYAATYFLIALGILLPSIYYLPDLHPLAFGVIMMLSCTLGTISAIAIFGSRTIRADGD